LIDDLLIGTRASALTVIQAETVKSLLEKASPGLRCDIVKITTSGDRDRKSSLSQMEGVGVFVKELESALQAGTIDFAVHSAKDLPSQLSGGFVIGAYPERAAVEDAIVSLSGAKFEELPRDFRIATSSPRRRALVKYYRPDLQVVEVRGNVDTRLRKLVKGEFEAIILAYAGLQRLGKTDMVTQILPAEKFVPAVGQGALAVEVLANNSPMIELVKAIDNPDTRACVETERAFLRIMNTGCSSAVGGYCYDDKDRLLFTGAWLDLEGKRLAKVNMEADINSYYEALGEWAAEKLMFKIQR
jgi:hydroxymethylbilane synthase